ncbi:hypothetical protein BGX34_011248 [Mortierella sp. NVP85]|nr:hypothetical protein BGX34_011248 [Mortierella sp. NVP85]
MSENEHKKRTHDDSDGHDSDSKDRSHKRVAVPDSKSNSPDRPQHRRRDDEDVNMKNNDEDSDVPSNMAIRALVSTKEAGIIIGKSGKNVNEIREQSGSRVNISEIVPGATERVLTITGRLDTIAKAYALVAQKFIGEQGDPDTAADTQSTTVCLLVPHSLMGHVIGKSGAKIKDIQEASGARLQASEEMLPGSTERTITITGVPDAIHIAVYHVGNVLHEKSADRDDRGEGRDRTAHTIPYKPMSSRGSSYQTQSGYSNQHNSRHYQSSYYGGYPSHGGGHMHGPYGADYMPTSAGGSGGSGGGVTQAQQIFIPNDMVGTVIGKSGAKINEIRQMSGSHIKIADAPHGSSNERLVTITGTPESNQMAVYLLYQRLESEKSRQ